MKLNLRNLTLVLGVIACASTQSFAQSFPTKPIRFVVGYAAGGGTDTMARAVATKLPEILKQQVIVENRPGANANLAAEYVTRQPADGYTVLFISVSHAMSKSVYTNLGYDIERDFVPLTLVAEVPNLLAVHPSLPVKTVNDLIKMAKTMPGQITYGVAGTGSPGHFAGEMLNMTSKIKMLAIPYKGGGPLAIDLMAGHVMATFNAMPPLLPLVRSNRIRAIAVSTTKRVSVLPDVPTIAESGVPGYAMSTWYGCVVKSGTPAEIVTLLNQAVLKTLTMPDVQKSLANLGADIIGGSVTETADFLKSEVAKYAKVAKAAKIRVDNK
jgi:tripartite-type tricarboxylate transporter receptor subunit TctC